MNEHVPEWVPGEGNLYCRVCGGDYGAPHNKGDEFDYSDEDTEEFCDRCAAGVDSSEHHEKCVVTGYAEDGESA